MPDFEELQRELAELRATPTPRANGHFEHLLTRMYVEAEEIRQMLKPEIHVEAPIVNVPEAQPPQVRVAVPDQSAAIDALTQMLMELIAAFAAKEMSVTVNVPENAIQVSITEDEPTVAMEVTFVRNPNGSIKSARITEEGL